MPTEPRQVGSDGRAQDLPVVFHTPPTGSCSPEWLTQALQSYRPTVTVPKEAGDARMIASDAANNLSVIDGSGGIYTAAVNSWSDTQTSVMALGATTHIFTFSGFGGTGLDPTTSHVFHNLEQLAGGYIAEAWVEKSASTIVVRCFSVNGVGIPAPITLTCTVTMFNFPAPNVAIP